MRPIEQKVLKIIDKKGINIEEIEEIVDGTSRQEMKKSFPDDCHFQSNRYFAKVIANSLLRSKLVVKEGNKLISNNQTKDKKEEETA